MRSRLQLAGFILFLNLPFFPVAASGLSEIAFRTISPQGGFTDKAVEEIIQDRFGFLWIATRDGLYKYDGYTFTKYVFRSSDPTSLSNDRINDLLIDAENRLWIATEDGLNLYNRDTDGFEQVLLGDDPSSQGVEDMEQGADGMIYVAAGRMLFRIDPENMDLEVAELPHNGIRKLFVSEGNQVFAAFRNNGVYLLSGQGEPEQIIPRGEQILRAACFTDSLIYLGYEEEGLKVFSISGTLIKRYQVADGSISHGKVNAILEDSRGNIWVGSYLGLDVISKDGSIRHFNHEMPGPYSLPYSSVFAIFEDSRKDMWVGTWSGGLAYYNRYDNFFAHFRHQPGINSISNDYVSSFTSDARGNLWIGTERGGLNQYLRSTGTYSTLELRNDRSEPLNVKSLLHTSGNEIFIGTYKGGFFCLDEAGDLHRIYLDQVEINNEKVYALQESDEGIWAGDISEGLYLISKKDYRTLAHFTQGEDSLGLTSSHVNALLVDQGDLWIGTNQGLNLKPAGKNYFVRFQAKKGDSTTLSSDIITTIEKDQAGNIWVGTRRGGLNKLIRETRQFIHYTSEQGLSGDDANGLLCDDLGFLWVSSENGISRFNPSDGTVNNYKASDGLQGNQFNMGSAYRGPDGALYFGGTDGYTVIHPDQIKINPVAPKPLIYKLFVNNMEMLASSENSPLDRTISEVDHIRLRYNQSSLSLVFTCDNYLNPSKNSYAFRLSGLDKTWQISEANQVSYSGLRPGKYRFELLAANNDGIWSPEPVILNITIKPPWWSHTLAYVIYILLTITAISLVIHMMLNRERLKSAIRLETIKRQNEEKIHQLKLKFFTNISHEFKTPLTLILSPLQRLVSDPRINSDIREDLELAEKNAFRLKKLVNQFIEFRKIDQTKLQLHISSIDVVALCEEIFTFFKELALRKKIDYSMNEQVEPLELWMDGERIENALFNILSNAFNYTPEGGQIQINIRQGSVQVPDGWHTVRFGEILDKHFVLLEVWDSGGGIPEEELEKIFERFYRADSAVQSSGSGIGLSLARDYLLLHHGFIQVASKPGAGSLFVMGIPLGKGHFDGQPHVKFVEHPQSSLKEREKELIALEPEWQPVILASKGQEKSLVLLIEDNLDLNRYLTKILSEHFRVVHTVNGEEGYSLAQRLLPELVISDILLPGTDGLELCRRIKNDPVTCHIPVVIITALSEDPQRIRGIEMGADAYITKPLDIKLLFSTIHNLIEVRKKLRLTFGGIQAAISREEGLTAFDAALIKRAREYVEKHILNPDISTTQLASELHMSRTNLHRKLKSLLDQSSTEFIKNIRMNKAMELMSEDGKTIGEVCYLVGFASTSYFSKCFKQVYGINPSEYKKNQGIKRQNP